MTSIRPEPFDIVDADGAYTPEFEARFAAYLTGLEADVDDPTVGADYRELLAMDREDLRALYAVSMDLMNAGPPPVTMVFAAVIVAVALIVAVLVAWYVL